MQVCADCRVSLSIRSSPEWGILRSIIIIIIIIITTKGTDCLSVQPLACVPQI